MDVALDPGARRRRCRSTRWRRVRFTPPVEPVELSPAPAPFVAPLPLGPAPLPPAPWVPLPKRLPVVLLPHPVDQATATRAGDSKEGQGKAGDGHDFLLGR